MIVRHVEQNWLNFKDIVNTIIYGTIRNVILIIVRLSYSYNYYKINVKKKYRNLIYNLTKRKFVILRLIYFYCRFMILVMNGEWLINFFQLLIVYF